MAAVRGRARTVYVGPEVPDNADAFDECRLGAATEVVPGLFQRVNGADHSGDGL